MIEIPKRLQNFLIAASVFAMSFNLANATANGQERLGSDPRSSSVLANTPQPTHPGDESSQSGEAMVARPGTGSISGTVVDPGGDVLQGAQVTLNGPLHSDTRTTVSGNNGQFSFTGLQPGVYKVAVTGSGMITFTSSQISLHAGEARIGRVAPGSFTPRRSQNWT